MADNEKSRFSTAKMLRIFFFLSIMVFAIVFAVYILMYAHRLGWTLGWIYVGIFAAAWIINLICLGLWNPKLIERRMRLGKGTKTWDKVWILLFTLAVIAIFVVVNIEKREGVSSSPGAAWLLGFVIFFAGWTLVIWSMVVNPFFEKMVRIQAENEHRVIDTGPYAYVRHPGYVGFVACLISTPLLLSSAWAVMPVSITVLLLVIRTALEDRTLRYELSGYEEYANRVGFRLIPGVW